MKNILFLLVFIPTLAFSQVSNWRSNPPKQTETYRNQSTPDRSVSQWRTQTEPIRPGQNVPNQPLVRRWRPTPLNPYGLMWGNRGWYQPYPYFWYDDFGYRNRGVVRIYEDGRRDTVRHKKPILNFIISKTNNNQIGASMVVGNQNYFVLDYVSTYKPDRSTFFPNGRVQLVDFPLIDDLTKEKTIYFGIGRRHKKTGVHAMIGFGNERVLWRGKDAIGEITFPKYNSNFTTLKFGILHDYKNISLKLDHDPIRGYSQFGLGVNL